jgi:hypothetical protein
MRPLLKRLELPLPLSKLTLPKNREGTPKTPTGELGREEKQQLPLT